MKKKKGMCYQTVRSGAAVVYNPLKSNPSYYINKLFDFLYNMEQNNYKTIDFVLLLNLIHEVQLNFFVMKDR